ncbi:hypothetical protein J3U75_03175 [Snodgrassella sp. B3088]|uniref:hypothetical protein n=1 Tax=Snodgrassella sp. B3088 TaxID=2818038 RepID=UPI00226AA84F|nr:hypothetical protein [Snodgrassella sp. B3088]MCX8748387.1 hypothetical protein [Snodgrassella sp. B3088]
MSVFNWHLIPFYGREGEEYNTRKGNNSSLTFQVFEPLGRLSRLSFTLWARHIGNREVGCVLVGQFPTLYVLALQRDNLR